MKNLMNILMILVIFLIINLSESVAQETDQTEYQIIKLQEFYDTQGVIVPESDTNPFAAPKNATRYTPSVEEVFAAELILKNMLYMTLAYSDYYIPFLEKRVRNFHRQYVGWKNEDGEKIISIIMYDFTEVKDSNKYLSEWRKRILLSLAQNKEYLDRRFNININKFELVKGSSHLLDEYWFFGKHGASVPHE